jgi:hypothetical protein
MAEIFWSAELLVASGSTFRVLLGYPLTAGVIVSAAVVTLYTLSRGNVVSGVDGCGAARAGGLGIALLTPFNF